MTTFRQFLNEQDNKQLLNQAADAIVRDCQPYIKQGGGVRFHLFRGMHADQQAFVRKHVRKAREPMSTPPAVQQFLDQWFKTNFGYPYRSGGLFVTGHEAEADYYARVSEGDIYDVYPIGTFSYVWSPTIEDLHGKLADVDRYLYDEYGEAHTLGIVAGKRPSTLSKLQQKSITDMLNANTFKTSNLGQAAYKGNEVMIACDSYYGIDSDVFKPDIVTQAIKERL